MLPFFTDKFGNAASKTHAAGREAEKACEEARANVAALIGADESEIVFTSGATESDNLAILGARPEHIVTVATEHPAVLESARAAGCRLTVLPVDRYGLVDPETVARAITKGTLVSVMTANNEVGTLQPIREIGRICAEKDALFHTDAAQAAGKIPLDVRADHVHLMSLSAHKMHGPKGVGALYVRKRGPRVRLSPLIHGGGHENGLRSGTLPVPQIVGFGRAAEIAAKEMPSESKRVLALRERLRSGLFERLDLITLNGHPDRRLPGNLHVSFAYVEVESLIQAMPEICVSTSAACASAVLKPSHVLKAMGVSDELAYNAIRFGIGRFNTPAEIDITLGRIVEAAKRIREQSPAYMLKGRE